MVQVGDAIVSFDVFREKFFCDLGACKGACCIEGDAGAPVMEKIASLHVTMKTAVAIVP